MALTGVASFCLPNVNAFAETSTSDRKQIAANGAIILFQGDSLPTETVAGIWIRITSWGMVMLLALPGRLGADFPEKRMKFIHRKNAANNESNLRMLCGE